MAEGFFFLGKVEAISVSSKAKPGFKKQKRKINLVDLLEESITLIRKSTKQHWNKECIFRNRKITKNNNLLSEHIEYGFEVFGL